MKRDTHERERKKQIKSNEIKRHKINQTPSWLTLLQQHLQGIIIYVLKGPNARTTLGSVKCVSVFFLSFLVRPFFSLFACFLALRSVIERMWMCFLWHFRSKKKMVLVLCSLIPPPHLACLIKTREKIQTIKSTFLLTHVWRARILFQFWKGNARCWFHRKRIFIDVRLTISDRCNETKKYACVRLFVSVHYQKARAQKKNQAPPPHGMSIRFISCKLMSSNVIFISFHFVFTFIFICHFSPHPHINRTEFHLISLTYRSYISTMRSSIIINSIFNGFHDKFGKWIQNQQKCVKTLSTDQIHKIFIKVIRILCDICRKNLSHNTKGQRGYYIGLSFPLGNETVSRRNVAHIVMNSISLCYVSCNEGADRSHR